MSQELLVKIGLHYDMCVLDKDNGDSESCYILNCKPYLFPLSSMTEEQWKELRNLIYEYFALDEEFNEGICYKTYGDILVWLDEKPINECYFIFDYFNKNHFDYRGLIPMGLAIDATNKNIYYDMKHTYTEEEKEKLFQAIKENGYKWNEETKTLEKLVEPKFKVGDKVVKKDNPTECWYVQGVDTNCNLDYFYYIVAKGKIANLHFKEQDDWELAPNKFDITTLKPFKSEVLVRNSDIESWCPAIFGCKRSTFTLHKYVTMTEKYYTQCIPYKGNEHLLGTTEDCNEFYKTWK